MEEIADKKRKKLPGLLSEFISLILKLAIMGAIACMLFTYVFGLTRNLSLNMQPAMQDGDLILFYRIVKTYSADEVVVIRYEGKTMLERIIAVGGDTVDITEEGLTVNGSLIQETDVIGETTQFEEGVTFPVNVPQGYVFVLGDNREHAVDSRIFGCVSQEDIEGRIMGLFRRRNF